MKDIYEKLDIPEPSADLENRIIAAAHTQTAQNAYKKSYFFQRIAVAAVCLFITVSVLKTEENQLVTKRNMLADIDFFSDQYGFTGDIS